MDAVMNTVRKAWKQTVTTGFLGLLALAPVHASPLPSVIDFTVNGQTVASSQFMLSNNGSAAFTGTLQMSAFVIDYSIDASSSPFLTYQFTIEDLTGVPLTFADHFSTSVFGGSFDYATASLSVSGAPGPGGGFALTTGGGPFSDVQATGASTFDLGVALGGNCPALTQAGPCYALQTSAAFSPQMLSSLDVYTNFTLSGQGSSITVNGSAALSVPEPATPALVFGAVCAMAMLGRVKRVGRRETSPALLQ
jgi:hypothetical protein